ncbi:M20/M25/M40 family metallo-hydrolase [candidate division KSB1 bacterium]|nr:M20/M25/M40 family metallo-hydrolase [candidate division KSB1 bacterium]
MKIKESKLLELFLETVRVDSVSLQERAVADFVRHKLQGWNIPVQEDDAATKLGGTAGNLLINLNSPGVHGTPLVLFAHLDTVRPTAEVKPVIENGIIRSNGTTILGADNRSAVALILYLISELVEHQWKHRNLEIVFTVAEELGMFGAMAFDYRRLTAKEGYLFDCSAKPGSYVAESPTAYVFQVDCKGRPAHSAVAPEKGINAISMAMEIIQQFPVGRLNRQTVANIGTIRGGTADNVVPDHVNFTGEFRSFNPQEIQRIQRELEAVCQVVGAKFNGRVEASFKPDFQGYKFEPALPVIQHLQQAMAALHLTPNPMVYSGGSDANVVNGNGIQAVNVGIGASNPHSNEEQIALADMVKGAELLFKLVEVEEV